MKTILNKTELISEYKEKLGMNIDFDEFLIEYNQLDDKILSDRALKIKNYLKLHINDVKEDLKPIDQDQEEFFYNGLFNTLSKSIKGFIEEENKILGTVSFTRMGCVGVYFNEKGFVYDLVLDNPTTLVSKIKSNYQKLLKYAQIELNSDIKKIVVENNLGRVQLFFYTDININNSKSLYNDLMSTLNNNLLDTDNFIASLGYYAEKKETNLINLDDNPIIGVFGGTGSGKTYFTKTLLKTVNILNKDINHHIVILDRKNDFDTSSIDNVKNIGNIDDINKITETIKGIHKEINKRIFEISDLGCRDYNSALNKGYMKTRDIFVLDEIVYLMTELKSKDINTYHTIREMLEDISLNIKGTGIYLFYSSQRPLDAFVPKTVKDNTHILLIGKSYNEKDFELVLSKKLEEIDYVSVNNFEYLYKENNKIVKLKQSKF